MLIFSQQIRDRESLSILTNFKHACIRLIFACKSHWYWKQITKRSDKERKIAIETSKVCRLSSFISNTLVRDGHNSMLFFRLICIKIATTTMLPLFWKVVDFTLEILLMMLLLMLSPMHAAVMLSSLLAAMLSAMLSLIHDAML